MFTTGVRLKWVGEIPLNGNGMPLLYLEGWRYSLDVQRKLKKFIRELHKLTTCVKITTQVEKARFDFQAVYMLRGKVDNIYDFSTAELSKIPIIEDLARIIGVLPGKRGNVQVDRLDLLPMNKKNTSMKYSQKSEEENNNLE